MHVHAGGWRRGSTGEHGRARGGSITRRAALALVAIVVVTAETRPGVVSQAQSGENYLPSFFSGLTWRCIGPFDGGPIASIQGVAGVPGEYSIKTPSQGFWLTFDGGDTWISPAVPGASVPHADGRQWTDPVNPRRIVRINAAGTGVEVTLNGGTTWMTASHHLPIAEVARLTPHQRPTEPLTAERQIDGLSVTVSVRDPARPGLIFAGTIAGAFASFDNGTTWTSLRLNMPVVAINDLDIRGNDLFAATQGRSTWLLADITPLRQLSASTKSAPATLFAPADATLPRAEAAEDTAMPGANIDYYLGAGANGDLTLEVLDASGRVVHRAESAAPDATDRWLPVMRLLANTPGHHRSSWNLRFDPPPSPHHRFAQAARKLFENAPAEPDGPQVLAGAYRVRLTVGGRSYVQSLTVRNDPTVSAADLQARRRQFDLALKAYDAMDVAHRGFLQLVRARAAIRPLLTNADPDLAKLATDLDARLNVIDGSDWTGLVIPDADNDANEIDEAKEGKHPDFVPPKPVSLSKDYDDPTSILGRAFGNVTHAPAFSILGLTLGDVVTRSGRESVAPDALAIGNYTDACQQLAGVLDEWRAMNALDFPSLNAELARQKLPLLPIATNVPTVSCTTVR